MCGPHSFDYNNSICLETFVQCQLCARVCVSSAIANSWAWTLAADKISHIRLTCRVAALRSCERWTWTIRWLKLVAVCAPIYCCRLILSATCAIAYFERMPSQSSICAFRWLSCEIEIEFGIWLFLFVGLIQFFKSHFMPCHVFAVVYREQQRSFKCCKSPRLPSKMLPRSNVLLN